MKKIKKSIDNKNNLEADKYIWITKQLLIKDLKNSVFLLDIVIIIIAFYNQVEHQFV